MKKQKNRQATWTELNGYKARPVTSEDISQWCTKLQRRCNAEAPNGYIIVIRNCQNGATIDLSGTAIANKFEGSTLFIQVNTSAKAKRYRIENGNLKCNAM